MKMKNKKGFSLLEAIFSIAIIAVSYIGLSTVISSATIKNMDLDISTTATYLGRGVMAETMGKEFSNIVDVAQTNFTGNFADYNYTINVDYVNSNDLNTAVAGPTSYKKVDVAIGYTNWAGSIHLYDLKVSLQ